MAVDIFKHQMNDETLQGVRALRVYGMACNNTWLRKHECVASPEWGCDPRRNFVAADGKLSQ